MKWTDENIDNLFKRAADEHQLNYRSEFFNEFEADFLQKPFVGTIWTDEAIDNLFKDSAARQQIEYKPVYWNNFELLLPKVHPVASAWTDSDIDNLFKDTARFDQVAYKQEYWNEFESLLPRRKKRDFLWFVFSYSSIAMIGLMLLMNGQETQDKEQIAELNTENTSISENEKLISEPNIIVEDAPEMVNETDLPVTTEIIQEESQTQIDNREAEDLSTNPSVNQNNEQQSSANESIAELNNNEELETRTETPNEIIVPVKQDELKEPEVSIDDRVLLSVITEEQESELNSVDELPIKRLERTYGELQPMAEYNGTPVTRVLPFVQALGGMSQSLITPSEHLSNSYGLGAGVAVNRDRFGVNLSVNAMVSNHQDLELSRTAKVYGFGSTVYNYDLNYQRLYQLEANLEFEYNIKRSTLRLGVRPSYLISTKVEFNKKDVYNDIDILESAERKTFYGYNEGITKFGIKPTIGYAYDIFPKFELGINVGVQLRGMVFEDYINGVNNRLPIDGQIYLRKYLVRH